MLDFLAPNAALCFREAGCTQFYTIFLMYRNKTCQAAANWVLKRDRWMIRLVLVGPLQYQGIRCRLPVANVVSMLIILIKYFNTS